MMVKLPDSQIVEILRIFAFDNTEDIWWREHEETKHLQIFANCSDLFWWGSADCEEITPENLHVLREAKEELDSISTKNGSADNYALLFACKVRQMRPQGAYYKYLDKETHNLFDACGPVREVGFGNPKAHPTEEFILSTLEN